ncbi:hypothetical protein ACJJTC_009402 [Scirpophaga incertulas]
MFNEHNAALDKRQLRLDRCAKATHRALQTITWLAVAPARFLDKRHFKRGQRDNGCARAMLVHTLAIVSSDGFQRLVRTCTGLSAPLPPDTAKLAAIFRGRQCVDSDLRSRDMVHSSCAHNTNHVERNVSGSDPLKSHTNVISLGKDCHVVNECDVVPRLSLIKDADAVTKN